jgi:hypothetical protein
LARKVIMRVFESKPQEENWSHVLAATVALAGPTRYRPPTAVTVAVQALVAGAQSDCMEKPLVTVRPLIVC